MVTNVFTFEKIKHCAEHIVTLSQRENVHHLFKLFLTNTMRQNTYRGRGTEEDGKSEGVCGRGKGATERERRGDKGRQAQRFPSPAPCLRFQ